MSEMTLEREARELWVVYDEKGGSWGVQRSRENAERHARHLSLDYGKPFTYCHYVAAPQEQPVPTGEVTEHHKNRAEVAVDRASHGWGMAAGHYRDTVNAVAQLLAIREQAAFERGRELAQSGWVAVGERMPDRGATVLFWCRDWLPSATPGVGKFGILDRGGVEVDVFTDETQLDQDDCGRVYPVAEVHCWHAFTPPPPPEPTNGR